MKIIIGIAAGLVLGALASKAIAARNSSGTYSLTAGQPVVSGTTITASTFNTLTADIATELTDSLSRSGKGGMTAPLRGADGSVSAPAFSWTSDTDTGLYRIGANNPAMSAGTTKVQDWTTTGTTITGTAAVTGLATVGGTLGVTGATCLGGTCAATAFAEVTNAGSQWSGNNIGQNLVLAGSRNNALGILDSAGANPWAIANNSGTLSFFTMPALSDAATGATTRLSITSAGAVAIPGTLAVTGATTATGGLTIGGSGTAITASFYNTLTVSNPTVNANSCSTLGTVTMGGSSTTAACFCMPSSALAKTVAYYGAANGANGNCDAVACNPTGGNIALGSGVMRCRNFEP